MNKELQRIQLLAWLEKKRDSYNLYSDKWLEYNEKYQNILFKIEEKKK